MIGIIGAKGYGYIYPNSGFIKTIGVGIISVVIVLAGLVLTKVIDFKEEIKRKKSA